MMAYCYLIHKVTKRLESVFLWLKVVLRHKFLSAYKLLSSTELSTEICPISFHFNCKPTIRRYTV